MRWAGHAVWTGEKRNIHKVLGGKYEVKRQFGELRSR
jgi:hypothetical protein